MADIIEGASLVLFGVLLLSVAWGWAGTEGNMGRNIASIPLALWGGWLIVQVAADVLAWLATVSVCIRCGG